MVDTELEGGPRWPGARVSRWGEEGWVTVRRRVTRAQEVGGLGAGGSGLPPLQGPDAPFLRPSSLRTPDVLVSRPQPGSSGKSLRPESEPSPTVRSSWLQLTWHPCTALVLQLQLDPQVPACPHSSGSGTTSWHLCGAAGTWGTGFQASAPRERGAGSLKPRPEKMPSFREASLLDGREPSLSLWRSARRL